MKFGEKRTDLKMESFIGFFTIDLSEAQSPVALVWILKIDVSEN